MRRFLIVILWLCIGAAGGWWAAHRVSAAGSPPAHTVEPLDLPPSLHKPVVRARAVAAGETAKPAGPAFEYEYVAPKAAELQPIYERVREADLLHGIPELKALDGLFMLPRPLRFVTAQCNEFGAFYVPESTEVVLCYETLKTLYERGEEQLKDSPDLGKDFPLAYTRANVRFIVLHETGHALVHLMDLPITGREEDAVDQLATTLMQRFASVDETPQQTAENLRMAANWMLSRSTGAYNLDAYADEHALNEQRYFNLQCMIYGSDPVRYVSIVKDGDLPEARAQLCPREAERVSRSWLRLLLPHLAPKYEMTEDEATRFFERKEREREQKGKQPYVR